MRQPHHASAFWSKVHVQFLLDLVIAGRGHSKDPGLDKPHGRIVGDQVPAKFSSNCPMGGPTGYSATRHCLLVLVNLLGLQDLCIFAQRAW